MVKDKATKTWKFFVGGKERESGQVLQIRNPYNDQVVGETWLASEKDQEEAIVAACRGFQKTKILEPYERSEILWQIRNFLAMEKEEYAELISLESGKPIMDARAEVNRCFMTLTTAAEEAKRMHGEYLDFGIAEAGRKRFGIYKPFPIGPILAITPFNFPLNLVAHQLAPAIAVGASFILKPASPTPLTALKFAQDILRAGYPPEAVNLLPCDRQQMEKLVQDERIKLLSFTGNSATGWKLKNLCGKKKVILELGGNAGVIVDKTADVEYAAKRCSTAAFSYSGQSCISVQRIFAHADLQAEFTKHLLGNVQKIKSGDPMDETVNLGPMIQDEIVVRSEAWVQEAVRAGAKLLIGGKRKGKFMEPTVLANVLPDMKVNCEEVFAPLVTIAPFHQFEEALQALNNSRYGLQAGLFTNDFQHVMKAYSELEVGAVMMNDVPTWRVESMPYGGVKDSGFGREGVRYTMQAMTEGKLLVLPVP